MEIALHLTSSADLGNVKLGAAKRIYWGHEFCQNLIPVNEKTKRVLDLCRDRGSGFTFLSPFVTESGLSRLRKVFSFLRREAFACEVVVNDWGVLNLLEREFKGDFSIVMGRLLAQQLREPELERIINRQAPVLARRENGSLAVFFHKLPSKAYQRAIKSSYANTGLAQEFLRGFSVKRVEFNNLLQGVDFSGIKLKKSLYTPFVNVSSGRFCPMLSKSQKIRRINVCRRECLKFYDRLRSVSCARPLFKKGNTLFYMNPVRPGDKLLREVDRLVVQPGLLKD
ncbi:MAG: hypothetical protein WBE75_00605 [Candidatus Omnitrophota bacterium]